METEAGEQSDIAVANQLANLTRNDLRAAIEDYNTAVANTRARLSDDLNSILASEKLERVDQTQMRQRGLSQIEAKLDTAVVERNRFETDRVLFLATIQASTTFKARKDPATALNAAAPEILATRVDILDGKGGQVTSTTSTVGEQLQPELAQTQERRHCRQMSNNDGQTERFCPYSQADLCFRAISLQLRYRSFRLASRPASDGTSFQQPVQPRTISA